MATTSDAGTANDFTIYDEEFWAGAMESIDQNVDVFNAASNNTMRIVTQRSLGNYSKHTIITQMAAAEVVDRRVNTADVADQADNFMPMGELTSPKLNRRIGPIAHTLDAWKKIGSNTSEMSLIAGRMIGEHVAKNYVESMVSTAVGALDAGPNEISKTSTLETDFLRQALALMGDHASEVVAWVMHSAAAFQLLGDQTTGTGNGYTSLESVAGAGIARASLATFGRPVIITDSASLVDASGTPDEYITLGLTRDGVVAMESEERSIVSQVITGSNSLFFRIQGEYAFNVSAKGANYVGAVNPADSTLATGASWTDVVSTKQLCGVSLRTAQVNP